MREVALNKHCLDSSDVFILDLGLTIFQWNGKTANKDERLKAVQYVQQLKVGEQLGEVGRRGQSVQVSLSLSP